MHLSNGKANQASQAIVWYLRSQTLSLKNWSDFLRRIQSHCNVLAGNLLQMTLNIWQSASSRKSLQVQIRAFGWMQLLPNRTCYVLKIGFLTRELKKNPVDPFVLCLQWAMSRPIHARRKTLSTIQFFNKKSTTAKSLINWK